MEASTARACLRRLSLFVNSVRIDHARDRSTAEPGGRYARVADCWIRHLSMDFLENTQHPSS